MSSKIYNSQKFWYRESPNHNRWLFKYPRKDTGEHWAEKIAAEVAALLNVNHATVELAELAQERGSATETFAGNRLELRHGNELLARKVAGYDQTLQRGQAQHTLGNIMQTIERLFTEAQAAQRMCQNFSGYLVLDALVGNTDRHHENWGILVERVEGGYRGHLAPSFDHASSLGRELLDERRRQLLNENRVGSYSERGRGGIFRSETDIRAPSPIELVRAAIEKCGSLFAPVLMKVAEMSGDELRRIVGCVPADWMSQDARDFAVALMCYNLEELKRWTP